MHLCTKNLRNMQSKYALKIIKYAFLANKNTKLFTKKFKYFFYNFAQRFIYYTFILLFIIYYIISVTLYFYEFFNLIKFLTASVITK
jgi:hypothetical protein